MADGPKKRHRAAQQAAFSRLYAEPCDRAFKYIQLCSEILQSDGEPLPDRRERGWKEKQKSELLDERRI